MAARGVSWRHPVGRAGPSPATCPSAVRVHARAKATIAGDGPASGAQPKIPSVTTLVGREDRLTFRANAEATRYGWLRLTPAYSVHLVAGLLERHATDATVVLDPYCGTGTTALVCAERGIACRTTDINPFLVWLARAKTARYSPGDRQALGAGAATVEAAIRAQDEPPEWLPALHRIERWWDEPTRHALGRAMAAIRAQDVAPAVADLLRVAFCRVL